MIRGPRLGLGTFFRSRTNSHRRSQLQQQHISCLVTCFFLILVQLLQPISAAASRLNHHHLQASPTTSTSSSLSSAIDLLPPSTLPLIQQTQAPINRVSAMLTSIASSSSAKQQQQHRHHQHQRQQAASSLGVAAIGAGGGVKPTPLQHHSQKEGRGGGNEGGSGSGSFNSQSGMMEEGMDSLLRLQSKNNLFIQSFPNGTISATGHDSSFYSILKQSAVAVGQIYIQGVASRLYICINECGRLYGSEKLEPDCILRDQMEGNWYNTYTSIKHSTGGKSLFMAFGSSTGLPCRLRMKSEKASDGRSVVALGSNEKHALFFPVRNISLPDGMNLTSLIQLNKRIPFERNTFKPTGCAPRCSKTPESIKESSTSGSSTTTGSSSQSNKKNKSKRKHNSCPCLSNETPGQGKVERCKRPRHCKQPASAPTSTTAVVTENNKGHHHRHHHQRHHHKNNGSSSSSSSGFNKNLSQDADRQREKDDAILTRLGTEGRSSFETETDWVQHIENNDRRSSSSSVISAESSVKQRVSNQSGSSSSRSNAMNSSKKRTSTHQREHQDKERRKKPPKMAEEENSSPPPDEPALMVNRRTKNKPATRPADGQGDKPTLHLSSHKGDSRLIRHMYRKIRAHPELAEELAALQL